MTNLCVAIHFMLYVHIVSYTKLRRKFLILPLKVHKEENYYLIIITID